MLIKVTLSRAFSKLLVLTYSCYA